MEKEKNKKFEEENFYTDYEENLDVNFFKNEDYQPFFNSSVWEDYEDLVYAIERDKFSQVLQIYDKEAIHAGEIIRPTGDNIMHV